MQLSDRFCVSSDVVAREVGGEMVLLDLSSGQYFGLNRVGGRFWELLTERSRDLAELCDCIEAEFDAPRDRIRADLLVLAEQLSEHQMIQSEAA